MLNRFYNGKIKPPAPHQHPTIDTIVLSDSEESQSADGDGLQSNSEQIHSTSGSSNDSASKTITNEEPLFYESRDPNDGRDIKPTYHSSQSTGLLLLPSSTPIEETPTNPLLCEYSLISDTSLAIGNESIETITVPDDCDMIRLDSVLEEHSIEENEEATESPNEEEAKESPLKKEEETVEENTAKVPLAEERKPSRLDATLEEGEIVDVTIDEDPEEVDVKEEPNSALDDSVIFVSEVKLPSKAASRLLRPLNTNLKNKNLNKPFLGLTQKRVSHIVQALKEKAATYRTKMVEKKEQEVKKKQQALDRRKKRMIIIDGSNVAFG